MVLHHHLGEGSKARGFPGWQHFPSARAPPADPSVQMTLVQLGVVQLGLVKWGWTQWTQYYGAFSKTAVTEKFRYQGKTGGAFSSGVDQKREQ